MTNNFEREKQENYKAYLENEKLLRKAAEDKRASTYLAMAEAASLEIGGRFKQVSPMTITGVTPIPQYPAQPEDSPFHHDPTGNLPDPLGFSVEDIGEPAGSPAEVERAAEILREQADPTVPSLAVDCADVVSAPVGTSLATVQSIATSAPHSNSPRLGPATGPASNQSAPTDELAGPTSSQLLTITGVAVVGEARNGRAANKAVPRSFPRRL